MSVAELQELEEVKNLLARGQELGVLTFADVKRAVAELDVDESDVDVSLCARPGPETLLPPRSSHYLLLTLARARLAGCGA